MFLSHCCSWTLAKLSILGLSQEDINKPRAAWRRIFLKPMPYIVRTVMFIFGATICQMCPISLISSQVFIVSATTARPLMPLRRQSLSPTTSAS